MNLIPLLKLKIRGICFYLSHCWFFVCWFIMFFLCIYLQDHMLVEIFNFLSSPSPHWLPSRSPQPFSAAVLPSHSPQPFCFKAFHAYPIPNTHWWIGRYPPESVPWRQSENCLCCRERKDCKSFYPFSSIINSLYFRTHSWKHWRRPWASLNSIKQLESHDLFGG